MNIGVDIRCLMNKNRTGVGEYAYGLLNAVFKNTDKHQFFLFYNSRQDVSANIPKWQQDNVHYVYTRWPNKMLNFLVWLKIIRVDKLLINKYQSETKKLRNKEISQFLNFSISQLDVWFSPNLNFTYLSKHVKHLQTVHDLSFEFLPECFTWKQRWWHKFLNPKKQCQRANVVVVPSENTARDVREKYKVESRKLKVLKPGLSKNSRMQNAECRIEKVRKKYDLPEKYILYLGTLEPRKNVESIIHAYKNLTPPYHFPELVPSLSREGEGKTKFPPPIRGRQEGVSLVIAGSSGWKNKKLLKLIQETAGIKYLGYITETEKQKLYRNASLFVFPSFYEGFGLPVLEAMKSGVPVITANRSSLPEVVGEAGYLVEPHNIYELSEAMKKILTDEKLRGILIERGLKKAESFDWQKSAGEFVKILESY